MIKAIFANDMAAGFGYKGRIPWKCPEDLKFFKEQTNGCIIVMGYNTWSTLPKLPNRIPIVISRKQLTGVLCLHPDTWLKDIVELDSMKYGKDIFIIGGAAILTPNTLEICEEILHSTIKSVNSVDVKISDDTLAYISQLKETVLLTNSNVIIRKLTK